MTNNCRHENDLFKHGSAWLKADFHLHTDKDPDGIDWKDNQNDFFKVFLDKLAGEDIRIGVITNHNAFYDDEFKNLSKKALQRQIFLLPGIELNVGDGKNGIHTLIVFDYKGWVDHRTGTNDIEKFINGGIFGQKTITPNESTADNLVRVIESLNKFNKDYFIILAHVDRDNGFFKETDRGRRERDYYNNRLFKERVLGFQRLESRQSIEEIEANYESMPASVDGSDPKKIEDIGRGNPTYLKIGSFNFEAVKYALTNPGLRVKDELPPIQNGYIREISFTGGIMDGKTIALNPNMNNFIGIRGSGKSTLLETVRYALDIPLIEGSKDKKYKEDLVRQLIGSGGQITLNLKDKHDTEYIIKRLYNEKPEVFRAGTRVPDMPVKGILDVLYFGQKDLSEIGDENFSKDVIDKFFGEKTRDVKERIAQLNSEIRTLTSGLEDIRDHLEKRDRLTGEKASIEEKLRIFKKYKVDEKLKRQVELDKDDTKLAEIIEWAQSIKDDFHKIIDDNKPSVDYYLNYTSHENGELFKKVKQNLAAYLAKFEDIGRGVDGLLEHIADLERLKAELQQKNRALKDEVAKIKREIDIPNLNPDDYIALSKRLNLVTAQLSELDKKAGKQEELRRRRDDLLTDLKEQWHQEYLRLEKAIKGLNDKGLSINVAIDFKGQREAFKGFLVDFFKGTGIKKNHIEKIAEAYKDPIEIYGDIEKNDGPLVGILNRYLQSAQDRVIEGSSDFLTYRVPDKITLKYKDIELNKHSLGQRASAFIIFILSKRDQDVIIVDQPEDDLDNQSIYRDVIKELLDLKGHTQFIFATHNPNIPVLGECEQVFRCEFEENEIGLETGSIDRPAIQEQIITVMEGGREAFSRRQRIYELWKS